MNRMIPPGLDALMPRLSEGGRPTITVTPQNAAQYGFDRIGQILDAETMGVVGTVQGGAVRQPAHRAARNATVQTAAANSGRGIPLGLDDTNWLIESGYLEDFANLSPAERHRRMLAQYGREDALPRDDPSFRRTRSYHNPGASPAGTMPNAVTGAGITAMNPNGGLGAAARGYRDSMRANDYVAPPPAGGTSLPPSRPAPASGGDFNLFDNPGGTNVGGYPMQPAYPAATGGQANGTPAPGLDVFAPQSNPARRAAMPGMGASVFDRAARRRGGMGNAFATQAQGFNKGGKVCKPGMKGYAEGGRVTARDRFIEEQVEGKKGAEAERAAKMKEKPTEARAELDETQKALLEKYRRKSLMEKMKGAVGLSKGGKVMKPAGLDALIDD